MRWFDGETTGGGGSTVSSMARRKMLSPGLEKTRARRETTKMDSWQGVKALCVSNWSEEEYVRRNA